MGVPWLDLKPRREAASSPLGGTVVGRFKGVDPRAEGFVLVEIGTEGNLVSVPHGGGVFPLDGPVTVQLDADGVPMGVLAGVDAEGETVALGATGKAIERQGDKLDKDIEAMGARVKAAAEGPVDTGRLKAGEVLIKGDLIAGNTIGAKHIVASEELEAKLATFRKVTTDELIAGNAKISGSLIADTLEGKTLKGGRVIVEDATETYGATITTSSTLGPVIGFAKTANGFDEIESVEWPLTITMPGGGNVNRREYGVEIKFKVDEKNGGDTGEAFHTLSITGNGVSRTNFGNRRWMKDSESISWQDIFAAAKGLPAVKESVDQLPALKETVKKLEAKEVKEEKRSFGDLDRDWRREPRPHELVKTGNLVDLFGGEWVRQNSEWNYTGNTWFNWGIIPEGYRPKQWVHFTVVITEDNFPHFAQGVIRPDGTFGLKLDKGIRVKPNVSRIMVPPVRWRVD